MGFGSIVSQRHRASIESLATLLLDMGAILFDLGETKNTAIFRTEFVDEPENKVMPIYKVKMTSDNKALLNRISEFIGEETGILLKDRSDQEISLAVTTKPKTGAELEANLPTEPSKKFVCECFDTFLNAVSERMLDGLMEKYIQAIGKKFKADEPLSNITATISKKRGLDIIDIEGATPEQIKELVAFLIDPYPGATYNSYMGVLKRNEVYDIPETSIAAYGKQRLLQSLLCTADHLGINKTDAMQKLQERVGSWKEGQAEGHIY